MQNGGLSEDGLTYTFKIRDGIKFHNGNDLTAEDAAYSWERALLQSAIARVDGFEYTAVIGDPLQGELLFPLVAFSPIWRRAGRFRRRKSRRRSGVPIRQHSYL